ncbi:hypothetical protein EMPS_03551 [Entomortierella parvispora]|uniref:Arm-like repeat domain-containing protein n=1 Tax=Entomortierella parvispora TaxID=205924 RepID=A0A9P3LUI4_9FUNG|nr:hypothetical protein EMPS_03551 [Entomortierella parvispora]
MEKSTPPPMIASSGPVPKKKAVFCGLFSKKSTKTPAPTPAAIPVLKSKPTAPSATTTTTPSKPATAPSSPPASAGKKSKAAQKSSKVIQVSDVPLGLFPENVARKENEFKPPETIDYIKSTVELVYYHTVLAKAAAIAKASSSPPSPPPVSPAKDNNLSQPTPPPPPPLPTLNSEQAEWVQEMEKTPLEKEYLRQMLNWMIDSYIRDPSKFPEAIREIVLLGPVLDKIQYRNLLNQLIKQFKASTLLDPELVRGMAQLIQDAGIGYLNFDDLTDILTEIRTREEQHKADEYLFYLTSAVTKILNAMVEDKVEGNSVYLDRIKDHEPTLKILSSLRNNKNDPFLKFQALYAYQAMQWIPNGESTTQRNLRHFIGVVGGLVKVSGVIQLDFQGFFGGLKEIQQEVSDICDTLSSGWEDGQSLLENSKEMYKDLKIGLGLSKPKMWYVALRGAERLVRYGQLADLNQLVSTAPCRTDPLFLWGICQLLGDIAIDSAWKKETRSQAITFLGEIFVSIADSETHRSVQNWVLTILKTVSEIPLVSSSPNYTDDEEIQNQATALGQKLKTEGNTILPFTYPLKTRLPDPKSSQLLRKINEEPDLDLVVARLRKYRMQEYNQFYEDDSVFVDPLAKPNLQASEDRDNVVPLRDRVDDFLDRSQNNKTSSPVMLILGDSGSGKSRFNRKLEYDLWNSYEVGKPIPLFVDLKSIARLDKDLIKTHLAGLKDVVEFTDNHLNELMQEHRPLAMICDGYDECNGWPNLYYGNKMGPEVKMIVTCRSQYMTPNSSYRSYFEPMLDPYSSKRLQRGATASTLVEAVIIPFMKDQIENYVDQHTKLQQAERDRRALSSTEDSLASDQLVWSKDRYMEQFEKVSHLLDLVKNPFLLRLMLITLPSIAQTRQDLSTITRVVLYDKYVAEYFRKEFVRLTLQEPHMPPPKRDAFQQVSQSFLRNEMDFSMDLADSMFKENNGVNYVKYNTSVNNKKASWKDAFFSDEAVIRIKRESCPLTCSKVAPQQDDANNKNKNQSASSPLKRPKIVLTDVYEFNHRSIMEYFFSCLMFSPEFSPDLQSYQDMDMSPILGLTECLESITADSSSSSPYLADHPFGRQDLAKEPSIVSFLAERVRESEEFEEQLQAIIILSKTDERASRAAANAITILIQAGVRFNGQDLRGIKIPGADLSFGQFDSAQLQGADLRNTTLRSTWLRQADLSGAKMEGADFAEWLFLDEGQIVRCSAYSPNKDSCPPGLWNGKNRCAFGLTNGNISLYDTTTWEKLHALQGHTERVESIAFSPCGNLIVSGSTDKTVRLWDAQTGVETRAFLGHEDVINAVAYSPLGLQVASGSRDKTVRLWDIETGATLRVLRGHTDSITSLSYSPSDGQQVISGSVDKTVRMWETTTGADGFVLRDHGKSILSVAYAPNGLQFASGSSDKTVRLWDAQTGAAKLVLKGHTKDVTCVSYSPDGLQIASSSAGKSVRLWDANTGAAGPILSGHTKSVWSVAYSPNGRQLATTSSDKTVRLWRLQTGAESGPILKGHHMSDVTGVAYSPKSQQVASCSWDNTVRLWDAQTGVPGPVLSEHTDSVRCVAFSPSGHQIVSGSVDTTVRLWDAQTGESGIVLKGHTASVWGVAYSPSGHQIASVSVDHTVRLWDAESGATASVLDEHTDNVSCVEYSPSGLLIASGSWDTTVRLWDALTGMPGFIFTAHEKPVAALSFSPNGKQIASGGQDRLVRLWDIETGIESCAPLSHATFVFSVAYSPDGNQIVSGGQDSTVRLWDVESGTCLVTVSDFLGPILGLDWRATDPQSSDAYLVTSSRDRSVCMWSIVEQKEGRGPSIHLQWSSIQERLVLSGASIQNVSDLSSVNLQLMQQRGAVGQPVNL